MASGCDIRVSSTPSNSNTRLNLRICAQRETLKLAAVRLLSRTYFYDRFRNNPTRLESINKLDHYYSTNHCFSNDLILFCHLDNVSAKLVEPLIIREATLHSPKILKPFSVQINLMSVKLGTYETVVSKLDIRQYSDRDVSNEIRQKILEAARQVGTGLNSQHLRFLLIESKDMLQLLAKDSTSGGWVSGANFAIMILTNSDYGFKMLDAGRALQNMQLVAWSEGVGSGLFTGVREKNIRTDFNIPEELDIAVIIGFGYPSRKLTGMKKNRLSMNNILYHQRYGNP